MNKEKHFLGLVVLAGLWISSLAYDYDGHDDHDDHDYYGDYPDAYINSEPSLKPPSHVYSFGFPSVSNIVTIGWQEVPGSHSYMLELYRGNESYYESYIWDRNYTLISNITKLENNTDYAVTVRSVFYNFGYCYFVSPESQPTLFTTGETCSRGREYQECSNYCPKTCNNPDPVCPQVCFPECKCPNNAPIWHQRTCIPRSLCPAVKGAPIKPTNLQVFSNNGTDDVVVVVVWDAINNVAGYTVEIRAANDSNRVIQRLTTTTDRPKVIVEGLSRSVTYVFSVMANYISNKVIDSDTVDESDKSNLILPPSNVEASNITNSSFRVEWSTRSDAVRYAFKLFDENGTALLYHNDKITGNIIDIDGLAPGTIYHYTVASVRTQKEPDYFMALKEVKTEGESVDTNMFYSTNTVTIPLPTSCQRQYMEVEKFYESSPKSKSGPSYPECTANGMYVKRQCNSATSVCRCVQPENGKTLRGGTFGGGNSAFELDCDNFGFLDFEISNFRVERIQKSSILLLWDPVPGIKEYVLVVNDGMQDEKTISVDGSSSINMMKHFALGKKYNFGIFAVNDQGWSGPVTNMNVTTLRVDNPPSFKIGLKTKNQAAISWYSNEYSATYDVTLLSAKTGRFIKQLPRIRGYFAILKNLNPTALYRIEVRAIAGYYFREGKDIALYLSPFASFDFQLTCELPLLDLIFVLDTSNIRSRTGLENVKRMFQSVINLPPAINDVTGKRVAAVTYHSSTIEKFFDYNRFSNTNDALMGIRRIRYDGGRNGNVAEALNFVTEHFFTSPRSDGYRKRKNSVSIVIFFAAGQPSEEIRQAAIKLQQVTNVIAVGVDRYSNSRLLRDIASSHELVLKAKSFDKLKNYGEKVVDTFCSIV